MTERAITKRPWNERPEQSDQTVNVLKALGFSIQLDFLDKKYDEHGTLISETFTKGRAVDCVERVTVDYTSVRTYKCDDCNRVGLVADKYTHADYHARVNKPVFDYWDNNFSWNDYDYRGGW